jgi:topoisomerase-4 subunit A
VIRDGRPAELDVEQVLRHNTERLLDLLRRELKLRQRHITEDLHRRTLVQIFIEHRLYQVIEACRSPEEIDQRVRAGLAPFRERLQRDVTHADMEMLLGLAIRRISQFDVEKNAAEMAALKEELAEAGRNLDNLVPYAVRYLRNLQRKHDAGAPRRTRIAPFSAIEVRELTASELQIAWDREKGYVGHKVVGEPLLQCSSLDKLLLVRRDGRYQVVTPPEKLFVEGELIHAAVLDRELVLTVVYTLDFFTSIKKFTVGGAVRNREYRCIPRGADIRMLACGHPPALYVRYAVKDSRSVRQQEFSLAELPVRDREARGVVMTSRPVTYVGAAKPEDWDDSLTGPRGAFLNV